MFIFPWEFEIPHRKLIILWEFKNSHLHWNLNNFIWEFTPVFLIISPATFEQVKSNAEPDIQHCCYGFPCDGLNVDAFLPKLNKTVFNADW